MKNGSKDKLIIIMIAVAIPIVIALLMEFSIIWKVETDNDWIGFFASYLGSIIGVLGVFEVMRIDQRKREQERKDELFIKNIELYKNIVQLLNVSKIDKLKKSFDEIKKNSKWDFLDTSTKKTIKNLESRIDYCDEVKGVFYAIEDFIRGNLFDELKIPMYSNGNEYSDSFEYEDLPQEIILDIANVVFNNSDKDLDYEYTFVINISKEEMLEKFEKGSYSKGYGNKIDSIYSKIQSFNTSQEWGKYVSNRTRMFKELRILSENIKKRIEELLDY
ncbi:MAG: hypothetical protein JXR88_13635 [Clostridia bacterium]|nr:hypothetical protein [Clostridia bacterium]